MYIYISIYLSIDLSIYLSIYLSTYLPTYLNILYYETLSSQWWFDNIDGKFTDELTWILDGKLHSIFIYSEQSEYKYSCRTIKKYLMSNDKKTMCHGKFIKYWDARSCEYWYSCPNLMESLRCSN